MTPEKRLVMQAAERVLGIATGAASGAEVFVRVTQGRDSNTRFAVNTITSTGDVTETNVSVQIALGKRHARSSTNQVDEPSLRALVARTLAMARVAPEDPEAMPVLGPQTYAPVPGAFDQATAELSAPARAQAIEAVLAPAKRAGLASSGYHHASAGETALASSAGLRAWFAKTNAGLGVTARTQDGTGSGWAAAESQRAADLDAAALAKVAIDKAVRSQKPRAAEPGRYTVVLEPAAVGALLAFLGSGFDARAVDEGRSFFSKPGGGSMLGEAIFPEAITIESNPFDPETPWPSCDPEGLPLGPFKWVDRGKVAAWEYSRYWAAQKGAKPTGERGFAKLLGGTAESTEALVKGTKRGFLVTRFWYLRTLDPKALTVTGLTRDGVFLIENGEVTAPVTNFRFNESPITMLKNVEAMTARTVRVPLEGGWGLERVPAIRTNDFNFASVSAAV